jgi:hypothetical protein
MPQVPEKGRQVRRAAGLGHGVDTPLVSVDRSQWFSKISFRSRSCFAVGARDKSHDVSGAVLDRDVMLAEENVGVRCGPRFDMHDVRAINIDVGRAQFLTFDPTLRQCSAHLFISYFPTPRTRASSSIEQRAALLPPVIRRLKARQAQEIVPGRAIWLRARVPW